MKRTTSEAIQRLRSLEYALRRVSVLESALDNLIDESSEGALSDELVEAEADLRSLSKAIAVDGYTEILEESK